MIETNLYLCLVLYEVVLLSDEKTKNTVINAITLYIRKLSVNLLIKENINNPIIQTIKEVNNISFFLSSRFIVIFIFKT